MLFQIRKETVKRKIGEEEEVKGNKIIKCLENRGMIENKDIFPKWSSFRMHLLQKF